MLPDQAFLVPPILGKHGVDVKIGMAVLYECQGGLQLGAVIGIPSRRSVHVRRFFTKQCLEKIQAGDLPTGVQEIVSKMQNWEVLQSICIKEVDIENIIKGARIFLWSSFENTYSRVSNHFLLIGHINIITGMLPFPNMLSLH